MRRAPSSNFKLTLAHHSRCKHRKEHPVCVSSRRSARDTIESFKVRMNDLVARLHSGEYTAPRVVTDASKFDSAELQQRIKDAKRGIKGARVPVRA